LKELKQQLENFLHNQHISDTVIPALVFLALLIVAGLLLFVSVYVTKKILDNVVGRIFRKTKGKWDDLLMKHNLFSAIGYLVSVIVLKAAIPVLFENSPKTLEFIGRLLDVYLVFVIIKIIIVFLKATEEYLSESQVFIEKPIASYFQLARILLYIIAAILGLSILLSKSPLYFIGAFGAMTAVILLIFKDTILGLVASVQISANDMVRVGDWVEMPKYDADGDVVAINLNTVKVSNWDKTITTVPTYYFISESFKNWRGMQVSGGRRIKRTLQISIGSIRFVDPEMRERFKGIDIIRESIIKRQEGIEHYNKENEVNTDVLINGVRMTNIGVFRLYIEKYLQNHSGINQEMTRLVRQLTPGEHGLPIEIYCFTNTIKWAEYENIQSDIFDHLVAAVAYFDLTIFQSPSGKDFKDLGAER
jgi:miniconductance mechanosensitive channel